MRSPPSDPASLRREPEWLQPPVEAQGLARYLTTLRERLWVLVLVPLLTTAVAVAYVVTADKVYESTANLLVTPVSEEDPALSTLGLIQEGGDPLRAIETAAARVTTNEVAQRVGEDLDSDAGTRQLLAGVSAEPIAESNLIAVTAEGGTPEEAAELANGFAEGVVRHQTETLHAEIRDLIPQIESQLDAGGQSEEARAALGATLARLETLARQPTPTLTVESRALPSAGAAAPRPGTSVAAGLLAGLVLAIGAIFGLEAIDPKLRREVQLRRQYRLPILGRIPREAHAPGNRPLRPRELSPAVQEAYRTLRGNLTMGMRRTGGSRVILVTGSSASEGKTTTAGNLAVALTLGGSSVIVIDADLRRPAVAEALGVEPKTGVVGVLLDGVPLEKALTPVTTYGSNLRLLAAEQGGGWMAELFTLPAATRMLEEARELADYVIIDSPPPTEVVDALPLAQSVDDILIVVRLGTSRLDRLHRLGELLAENGLRPTGLAVVGTRATVSEYYQQETSPPGRALPGARRAPGLEEERTSPDGGRARRLREALRATGQDS